MKRQLLKRQQLRKGRPEIIGRCYVEHCGHPTAIWPWALYVDGELIAAPNGTAFTYKRDAVAAARLVNSRRLAPYDRGLGTAYPRVLALAGATEWTQATTNAAWRLIERGEGGAA